MNKPEVITHAPEQTLIKSPNLIKKTIKRKVTVGKSKKDSKVAVIIKDRDTRKQIIGAQEDKNIAIALVLPLGVPAAQPKHPGRLPANKTIFTDRLPSPSV